METVYGPKSDNLHCLVQDLCNDIKYLTTEILDMKKEIVEMKNGYERALTELTEEIIAVKLENRQQHNVITSIDDFEVLHKLPLYVISDLEILDNEVQKNVDKLRQFVNIEVLY